MRTSPAEFITLREMCGLTQSGAAEAIGASHRAVQHWEAGERAVPKAKIDAMRNLDDLIRLRATLILEPHAMREAPNRRVDLLRYRCPEDYEAAEPGHVAAGLSWQAYHAMLWRVMDGLARLRVRYLVRWPEEIEAEAAEHAEADCETAETT